MGRSERVRLRCGFSSNGNNNPVLLIIYNYYLIISYLIIINYIIIIIFIFIRETSTAEFIIGNSDISKMLLKP